MLIPVGLAVGVVTSLVSHLKKDVAANELKRFSQELDLERLTDTVDKITSYIGDRSLDSEAGRLAMRQMSSFLQGELSPQNSGLQVHRDTGIPVEGRLWYHYWVNIEGKQSNNIHLVLTHYNGPKDTGESAKLAALISVAQSLGAETPEHSIRFVFAPTKPPLDIFTEQAKLRCLLPSENCIQTTVIQTNQHTELDTPDDWFTPINTLPTTTAEIDHHLQVLTHSSLETGTQEELRLNRAAALLNASLTLRKIILDPQ